MIVGGMFFRFGRRYLFVDLGRICFLLKIRKNLKCIL